MSEEQSQTHCGSSHGSLADQMIDVWEVWPHYDKDYDYILTDDGSDVERLVQAVAESWMDSSRNPGEELRITVKAKEMTPHDYEEATAPAP